jgi:hypothetical protein
MAGTGPWASCKQAGWTMLLLSRTFENVKQLRENAENFG